MRFFPSLTYWLTRRLWQLVASAGLFVAGALPQSGWAQAAPATAAALLAQPGYYRVRVGTVLVTALSDGTLPLPMRELLTTIPAAEIDRQLTQARLPAPGETSVNGYLVDLGARLVLVDAGSGELLGPTAGHLLASLRAAGYQPAQVTDILLTHLHSDHTGGLVRGGQRVFPNAVVHLSQVEMTYCFSDASLQQAPAAAKPFFLASRPMLRPYQAAGKVQPFTGPTPLFAGMQAVAAPGHTPGHTVYVLESQGQQLAFWGDVLHAVAVQLPQPAVSFRGDTDQAQSALTRQQDAAVAAAGQRYWVAGAHISFPGIGHVRAADKGYEWVPLNYSINGTGQ